MSRPWEADPWADFKKRWGKSPQELGLTSSNPTCPDMWELTNGDVALVGRDLTDVYTDDRLPEGLSVGADERIVVVPRALLVAAREDIPDA